MSDYQGNIIIKNPATPTGPSAYGSAPGMWKLNEVAYWIKQGVWPNPVITPDQYFPYVSLLLSTTSLGNANNNLFVDSSGAFNPISRNGNTTQGSFTPYGSNWSNYFDGTGDYERISSSQTALQFGTGDFTVEGWVNSFGSTGTYQQILTGGSSWTSGSGGIYWYYNGGSPYIGAAWNQVATNPAVNSATLSLNTWYHFAVVRSGNTLYLYVNGTSVDTLDVTGVSLAVNNQSQTNIGGGGWDSDFGGYLSNLRVVKGTAVYTSNFTVPTSPLTAISGTSLLTCQSNRFRDASTNNFTITANGNTSVTEFSPFSSSTYTGISYNQSDIQYWSGYFDGSGDYVDFPAGSGLGGSGDFTVQAFIYPTTVAGDCCIYETRGGTGWVWFINSTGYLQVFDSSAGLQTASTTQLVANTWTHVALVKSGSTCTYYVNGSAAGTFTRSSFAAATRVRIGARNDAAATYFGYISNLRTDTSALTITVPTSPLSAVGSTNLLTCQSAAFTDNSTNNAIATINGNTTVTGNNPFQAGYYSNYFDGSGDYLSIPSNAAFSYGTADFTMEAWVYKSATGSRAVFDSYTIGAGGTFGFLVNDTQIAGYQTNVATYTFTYTVPLNTWTHIAFVRTGGNLICYVNGTSIGSQANSANFTSTQPLNIGRNAGSGGDQWLGYISNLRVVKGTAVYTANFTPSTTPLTAISGTSLLTCQSARFIDTSSNNFTITRFGDTAIQSFDPFYTSTIASNGGSMYFDASGDYLNVTYSTALFDWWTSDYTIDGWFYANNLSTVSYPDGGNQVPVMIGNKDPNSGTNYWSFGPTSDGYLRFYYFSGSGNRVTSTTTIGAGRWTHVAMTKTSSGITLFVNGVAQTTTAISGTPQSSTSVPLSIGQGGSSAYAFNGYMSGLRITKGTALYSATFTPPTAPVTPTAATTLLVNGMNAGVYDATAISDMETVGDAKVLYFLGNYYAGSFDGTGDYLSTGTSSAIALTTADFTLECWVYPSAFPNDATLVYVGTTTTGNEVSLQIRRGQVASHLYVSGSHSDVQFTDLAPQLNRWSHLAISRVSGVLYGFLNGVRSSVTQALTTNFGTSALAAVAVGDRYAGSISNARITKNAAIYSTATYTVPTSPLAATSNTAFLTCQNTTFVDNSPNALAITAYGNATAGATGPFTYARGNSVYFDGSGDNLFLPSSPTMNFASGNWTIEGWVLVTTRTTNYPLIFGNNRGSFTTDALAITASNSDNVSYNNKFVIAWGSAGWSSPSAGNSQLLVSSVANVTGSWYHLAIVRNGTSVKMYRDGTEVASATVSAGATFNWGFNGTLMGGGNWDGAQGAFNGYLNNMRITPGIARYTANFTPPTTPFPPY